MHFIIKGRWRPITHEVGLHVASARTLTSRCRLRQARHGEQGQEQQRDRRFG